MTKRARKSSPVAMRNVDTDTGNGDSSRSSFLRLIAPLALPMAAQQFMVALSSCADSLMMTGIGQNELSGVSLATQFQFVFSLFLTALTVAMSTLVAQYWGIKDNRTVSKVSSFVMRYVLLISLVFFLLLIVMPDTLIRFMTNDPSLIPVGAEYLRISAPSYFFLAASQVLLCLMRNTGLVARTRYLGQFCRVAGPSCAEYGADLRLVRGAAVGGAGRGRFESGIPGVDLAGADADPSRSWLGSFRPEKHPASRAAVAARFLEVLSAAFGQSNRLGRRFQHVHRHHGPS
ncbi:MATE family efflux transporter [Bifidobacterium sp. ESL0745]|uniref:MATE family efflux transporter n=1 Tax=Bifidobacterium sp. ESL0745 TaxID=2983226 RepID=UPI0023F96FC4|nr:MATE family efflux transporter [Bifidobacterium sp. ESL0745]MDF7664717.1 MATE family efflux transporter [Bifidobacterium sp. ESL0745]